MIGHIEWKSRESTDTERANITRCVEANMIYRIEFSNTELRSEGRMEIRRTDEHQHAKGMYMFTDDSYKGEADVEGQMTQHENIVTFTGIWHDPKDKTGEWDVYIEFENDGSTYTFTYAEEEKI